MILVLDELFDGVTFTQNFRISKSISLAHIRPWIYKEGTLQDGDFTLEVKKGAEILKTIVIPHTDINDAITATFGHGQLRFDVDALQLNHDNLNEFTEYTMSYYMDNHVTDASNFIGIVRRYELKFYDTYGTGVVNNEAPNDMVEPAGFEIYNFTR